MNQVSSYGYANEVKVHVIGGRNTEQKLMNELDQWLREHASAEVLDIKYGYGDGYYSAMIIYRG